MPTTDVRHPIVELSLARLREWLREPEAIFWAFIFPIVMSVALAVAFPGQQSRPVVVGVTEPGTQNPEAAVKLRASLEGVDGVTLRDVSLRPRTRRSARGAACR